ncbi:MAG: ribosomal RNA small subunit methyltransferase A [Candidatus Melainabacteria bacterium]|nr:ribosomal RNA small subunit methyltransferase A [Candidatus Melainabacteria bacterium]
MKKSFGQHLLTDKNYLKKILNEMDLKRDDSVLEIGSGTGLLTCLLAQNSKKVFAVEPEKGILKKLKENLAVNNVKNVEIVEADFLDLDLTEMLNSSGIVVGNIPYNITSKILIKLFGEIDKPVPHIGLLKRVYLMLQYEVAKRIVSSPNTKDYSPLTLLVQYFSCPKILFKVPRGVFYPVPRVDSAFVRLDIKKNLQTIKNPSLLKNVIRISFQQRRKKVINALSKLCENKDLLGEIFTKLHLDHNLRAENLEFEKFLAISDILDVSNYRHASIF